MKLIVAVDLNWGIGFKGNLLQRIPGDMKFFKNTTLEKVVVMGRETFESFPKKEPLKNRVNIVLTKKEDFYKEDLIICHSIDELFIKLKGYNLDDVFIIGGESIYTQLLPYCKEAYITKISNSYEADKYFPNLDKEKGWELISEGEMQNYNDIEYRFVKYLNKASKAF